MASTGKCEYCGADLRPDEQRCPDCGAPNPGYTAPKKRRAGVPATIDELRAYCAQNNMPLQRMRFFIGEDTPEPRAFGICRDGDAFVVYKNKADGTRAERYRGPDEALAVSELYKKLLLECHARDIWPDRRLKAPDPSGGARTRKKPPVINPALLAGVFVVLFLLYSGAQRFQLHRNDGYYDFGTPGLYYLYGDDWFYADDSDDWYAVDAPAGEYHDYYVGEEYQADWDAGDFQTSDIWEDLQSDSSSGFFDFDDYDDWDSGDTDWDSDW